MCALHITYDKEHGRVTIGKGHERYIIIPMRAYAAIIDAVVGVVGVNAAGALLYYLGKRIGRGLAEELRARMEGKKADTQEFVKTYAAYLEELGFGKVEVEEVTENSATIVMREAPSLAGIKAVHGKAEEMLSRDKICYLEAGMMAAAFEDYLGGRWRGVEVKHGGLEDPCCVIRVTREA